MNWLKIFVFILLSLSAVKESSASPEQIQNPKELTLLKELLHEGNKNSKLYLRLSELSQSSAEALCYARLGLEIDPNSPELANKISSLRSNSLINEDVYTGRKKTVSSPSLLFFLNFISKDQLSLVLFSISSLSLLLFVAKVLLKSHGQFSFFQKILYLSSLILFLQLFLVVKTKDARFRLASSFSDFNKIEGVVLSEKNVYSAPSETSQEINILKPSWEINIYSGDSDEGWHLIESSDKRQGWIKNLDGICPIIN